MSSTNQKVSFTIRRPTPPSRNESPGGDSDNAGFKIPALPRHVVGTDDSKPGSPLARSRASSPGRTPITTYGDYQSDSSDEEDDHDQDELLTSFDQIAVQRSSKKRKSDDGSLVIPVLKNKDWRELARKRRGAAQFVPAAGKAQTGKDGSVGGLGTKDLINTGPVFAGLQIKKKDRITKIEVEEGVGNEVDVKMEVEETEDERALRAVLASAEGVETEGQTIRIISTPVSESDALKQDMEDLPDVASLEDYERIPVSQFGAAMLRGMGWKDGTAASRNGKGLAEPYLPQARPALLGIGAKEKEILDDGSGKKRNGRPERKYIPVVKRNTPSGEEHSSPNRSCTASRRSSRSPDRKAEHRYDAKPDNRLRDSNRERRDRRYDDGWERDRNRHRERDMERDTTRGDRKDRPDNVRRRDGSRESRRR